MTSATSVDGRRGAGVIALLNTRADYGVNAFTSNKTASGHRRRSKANNPAHLTERIGADPGRVAASSRGVNMRYPGTVSDLPHFAGDAARMGAIWPVIIAL